MKRITIVGTLSLTLLSTGCHALGGSGYSADVLKEYNPDTGTLVRKESKRDFNQLGNRAHPLTECSYDFAAAIHEYPPRDPNSLAFLFCHQYSTVSGTVWRGEYCPASALHCECLRAMTGTPDEM